MRSSDQAVMAASGSILPEEGKEGGAAASIETICSGFIDPQKTYITPPVTPTVDRSWSLSRPHFNDPEQPQDGRIEYHPKTWYDQMHATLAREAADNSEEIKADSDDSSSGYSTPTDPEVYETDEEVEATAARRELEARNARPEASKDNPIQNDLSDGQTGASKDNPPQIDPSSPVKRGRGRPKGSRNKPKLGASAPVPAPAPKPTSPKSKRQNHRSSAGMRKKYRSQKDTPKGPRKGYFFLTSQPASASNTSNSALVTPVSDAPRINGAFSHSQQPQSDPNSPAPSRTIARPAQSMTGHGDPGPSTAAARAAHSMSGNGDPGPSRPRTISNSMRESMAPNQSQTPSKQFQLERPQGLEYAAPPIPRPNEHISTSMGPAPHIYPPQQNGGYSALNQTAGGQDGIMQQGPLSWNPPNIPAGSAAPYKYPPQQNGGYPVSSQIAGRQAGIMQQGPRPWDVPHMPAGMNGPPNVNYQREISYSERIVQTADAPAQHAPGPRAFPTGRNPPRHSNLPQQNGSFYQQGQQGIQNFAGPAPGYPSY